MTSTEVASGVAASGETPDRISATRRWIHKARGGGRGEMVVTAVLGAAMFVVGFGDLSGLTRPLGRGDLLPAYALAEFWSDGNPFGNDRLGFPFGSEQRYFPSTDYLQNVVAGLITAVTGNPFVGIHLVYALSFPATAMAALWVFRLVGVRGPVAVFTSLAYTAIPFHWLRLEHLYLSVMYPAVLGIGLAVWTGTGRIERGLAGERRRPTVLAVLAIVVVIAGSGIYYAFFSLLLVTVAVIYRWTHSASLRRMGLSLLPVASLGLLTVLALLPAFVFQRNNPPLVPLASRLVIESVSYSGVLAFTLVPAPLTEVPLLDRLNPSIEHAFAAALNSGTSGVFWYADFGSLFSCLAVMFAAVGAFVVARRRTRAEAGGVVPSATATRTPGQSADVATPALLALLTATTILFFVPWGLNVLFSAVVTPQIRAWDRLVPVLLLLFFTAAMLAWRELRLPQSGRWVLVAVAVGTPLLLLDSVVPHRAGFTVASENGAQDLAQGRAYGAAVNAAIPGDCGMLELPYLPYPEQPTLISLPSYDPLIPALANPDKDWSFAAMKGTVASEWQRVLSGDIDDAAARSLALGGFCGVHVDRRGLTPQEGEFLAERLTTVLGAPVATGRDGDWTAYRLPPVPGGQTVDVAAPSRLTADLRSFYYPPLVAPRPEDLTVGIEQDVRGAWLRLTAEATVLEVTSVREDLSFNRLTGSVRAGSCSGRDVTLTLRSGDREVRQTLKLAPGKEREFSLVLPTGTEDGELTVGTPGAACTEPDGKLYTVALTEVAAT